MKKYPFILKEDMPPKEEVEATYIAIGHTLSPLKEYHFRVNMNKEWKVLDKKITSHPSPGVLTEIGVIRGLSENEVDPIGDVTFYTTLVDSKVIPGEWLDQTLQSTYGKLDIEDLTTKEIKTPSGVIKDRLFKYNHNNEEYVSRSMAYKVSDNEIVMIQGTALGENYHLVCNEFFMAIISFKYTARDK